MSYTDDVSTRTTTGLPEIIDGLVSHISTSTGIEPVFSVADINELPTPLPSLTFVTVAAGDLQQLDEYEDIIQPTEGNDLYVDFRVQVSLWVRSDDDQAGRSTELLSQEADSAARQLESLVRCISNQELKLNGEFPLMRAMRYDGTAARGRTARQPFLQYVSTFTLQFQWGL